MENKELIKAKKETIKVLNEYLDALNEDVITVYESIRNEENDNKLDYIKSLVQGFQMVCEAIDGSEDELAEKIDLKIFIDKIKEIIDAVKNQDYILVADLLEYEISPILNDIKRVVIDSIDN